MTLITQTTDAIGLLKICHDNFDKRIRQEEIGLKGEEHRLRYMVPKWLIQKIEAETGRHIPPDKIFIYRDIPVLTGYEDKVILYHLDYTVERDQKLKVEIDLTKYVKEFIKSLHKPMIKAGK